VGILTKIFYFLFNLFAPVGNILKNGKMGQKNTKKQQKSLKKPLHTIDKKFNLLYNNSAC
jgi:hypothetical protein